MSASQAAWEAAQPTVPDSALGRLLQELSWAGSTIRSVRDGGRAHENVLTTEVLSGLDFLPRDAFLGAVLQQAHGADEARARLIAAGRTGSGDCVAGGASSRCGSTAISVASSCSPTLSMTTPGCYVLVEAKRIRWRCLPARATGT